METNKPIETNKSNEQKKATDTLAPKKRTYQKMTITPIELLPSYGVLVGSVTNHTITVENVTASEFAEDESFPADGFDVNCD